MLYPIKEMRVYVAGAYCDKPTVQQVQNELKTMGYFITHDWTTATNTTAREDALYDERGVKQADVVVLVFSVPGHAYRGTFTEMGMALGLGKIVFALCLVDGDYKHNVFLQLPQIRTIYSLDELVNLMKDNPFDEWFNSRIREPDANKQRYVPIQDTFDSDSSSDTEDNERIISQTMK